MWALCKSICVAESSLRPSKIELDLLMMLPQAGTKKSKRTETHHSARARDSATVKAGELGGARSHLTVTIGVHLQLPLIASDLKHVAVAAASTIPRESTPPRPQRQPRVASRASVTNTLAGVP